MTQFIMRVLFVGLMGTFGIITRTEQVQIEAEEYWRVVKLGDSTYRPPRGAQISGIEIRENRFGVPEHRGLCVVASAAVNRVIGSINTIKDTLDLYYLTRGVYKVQKNRDAAEEFVQGYKCKFETGGRSFLLRVTRPVDERGYNLKAYIENGPEC